MFEVETYAAFVANGFYFLLCKSLVASISTTLPKLARQNKACTGIHWRRYSTQKETCMPSASKVEIFYIDADCRGTISALFRVRNRRQRNVTTPRGSSASLFENPVFLHLQRPFFRVRPSVFASRATLECA